MYGEVELPPEVLKDLAEAFLGGPAAPEGEAEQACGAQLPWASLPALGKDVFPDYLGFEQARSSRLHQDHQASAWRPLAQQARGQTGAELSGAAQGRGGWEQEGAHGTPEPSISPEVTAYTGQECVDEPELEEPPRALTQQKRQSARLQAAAGASSSGGRARAAAVGLAAAAAACDSDGAADLVEAALTTDPKMRKLRLKNKNAQKRFRDRQKAKLQECQERIEDLEQQLQAAKAKAPAKDAADPASEGTLDASQQPGVRELMGDRTELRISVWAAPDNSVTVDQVAKWTWQQHGQLWKEYVTAVGPLVREVEETSLPTAMKELSSLVDEIVLICACVGATSPANMRKFHCLCMDADCPAEAPATLWAEVAARLELSEAQQEAARAAYCEYLGKLHTLLQQRAQFAAWLVPSTSTQAQQTRVSRDHLAASDLLAQLRLNLSEEDQALLQLSNHWYCQVISPLQVAKSMLLAVPYTPDVVSIMHSAACAMPLPCPRLPHHQPALALPDLAPCYGTPMLM